MNNQANQLYLALDFDGVLHHAMIGPMASELAQPFDRVHFLSKAVRPEMELGLLFDHMSVLEKLLQIVPAQIVITTSWRQHLNFQQLKEFFPYSIASRIVGVIDRDDLNDRLHGRRGELVDRWMKEHGGASPLWFALDDMSEHYAGRLHHLVDVVFIGMAKEDIPRCIQKVNDLATPAVVEDVLLLKCQ